MLVIRLQRVGKKNQASFRVVLQEKTWSPKGKAKELLGFYNPVSKEKAFQKERITYWIQKGAEPSPTVHNMLIDEGLLTGKKVKSWQPKKKEKKAEEKPTAEVPAGESAPTAEGVAVDAEPKTETTPEANVETEAKPEVKPEEKPEEKTEVKPAEVSQEELPQEEAQVEAAPKEEQKTE